MPPIGWQIQAVPSFEMDFIDLNIFEVRVDLKIREVKVDRRVVFRNHFPIRNVKYSHI